MPKKVPIKLWAASTAGNVPSAIRHGEIGVDALSDPPRLWTGVPTSRDPSGRLDLLAVDGMEDAPANGTYLRTEGEWVAFDMTAALQRIATLEGLVTTLAATVANAITSVELTGDVENAEE